MTSINHSKSRKPICECGKPEEHAVHERYGNDVNNPRKHRFNPKKRVHRHRYDKCGDYKYCPGYGKGCYGGVNIYCRCGKRKP